MNQAYVMLADVGISKCIWRVDKHVCNLPFQNVIPQNYFKLHKEPNTKADTCIVAELHSMWMVSYAHSFCIQNLYNPH